METARRIGQDRRHFKCQLSAGKELIDAIFWGVGDIDPCRAGDVVDLVFEPEVHEWYGEHVQLICRDIREEKVSLSMGLAVFEELELLSRFSRNGEEFYQRRIATKKLDLMESEVYRKHRMF